MKYFTITAKIVEVIILSVQNEIPCGNLIHEHGRSLQGEHAGRPSGMQKRPGQILEKGGTQTPGHVLSPYFVLLAIPALRCPHCSCLLRGKSNS